MVAAAKGGIAMNGGILKRFRVRLGAWQTTSLLLALAGLACGVAAAAILTDAAIDFSDRFRALLPWCVLALLGAFTIWAFWRIGKLDEFRIARLWERSRPELGSKLSNAVQLARLSGGTDVQEYLRHESVQLG